MPEPRGSDIRLPSLPTGLAPALEAGGFRLYLKPIGLEPAGPSVPHSLGGGPLSFSQCELLWREVARPGEVRRCRTPVDALEAWARGEGAAVARWADGALKRLTRPRPGLAGLSFERPSLMGVLNVTPDSFSDGGAFLDPATAIAHGRRMMEAGAGIVDVGGESTRPRSGGTPVEDELARVVPVVSALAAAGVFVSIDTRRARVMAAALDAGAKLVNDVSALTADTDSAALIAARNAPIVLMHMRGEPATMHLKTDYAHVALDVYDELGARLETCAAAGIAAARIVLDPGLGFAKTSVQNAQVMAELALYHGLGCALAVGASRKGLVSAVKRGSTPQERLPASLAAALLALDQGVQLLRVHDVAETAQALSVWRAVRGLADSPASGMAAATG
ncbi:MAG: dihydropteroate synthase [Alphaproteobacteria bacterium]